MKEFFKHHKFRNRSLQQIARANAIIEEYQAQGFKLTLRQLYYQFVARAIIPNSQKQYDALGALLSKARLAGLVDWNAIVDRTRNLAGNTHWLSPNDIINNAARGYKIDKWKNQPHRVEVWIEKEALVGVIERICGKLDVDFFACRGYVSQSEQWRAGRRFNNYISNGQTPVVIHLGDHDPSGIDMTRDNDDRLAMFARTVNGLVLRIALNMDQVEEHNPPPNPAKFTDSRYEGYVAAYGKESWELDALDPKILHDLIEKSVKQYRDEDLWNESLDREREERDELFSISENYGKVVDFLNNE